MTASFMRADEDSRDSSSPFGVLHFPYWNHDWNNHFYDTDEKQDRAAQLIQDAGIRFVRMDFLWADIEPEKGQFDFEAYDKVVSILQKHDIKILGILEYNPTWSGGAWNAPPDQTLYLRYAKAVVHHFKDRVMYWEVWNEPDQKTYWDPQDGMATYSRLLKAAYPVIKEEDPTSKVLMGSPSNDLIGALRGIYKQAGPQSFDIVNIHPFVDHPTSDQALITLRGMYTSVTKIMKDFGDEDKPIWFTEIGCPGVPPGVKGGTWWGGEAPTDEQQAAWLETIYSNALQWKGVQKIFWAFFRDTDHHFGNAIDYFGLVQLDFTPKPAYKMYKKLTANPSL